MVRYQLCRQKLYQSVGLRVGADCVRGWRCADSVARVVGGNRGEREMTRGCFVSLLAALAAAVIIGAQDGAERGWWTIAHNGVEISFNWLFLCLVPIAVLFLLLIVSALRGDGWRIDR